MSRQPRNNSSTPAAPSATRMNEYFVPRDGIDREVISADICRYLGNDALVRPGHYEDPATGQIVQGYYITAYRNLTTAMIEDLKADSARWDNERRTQSTRNANAPGGIQRDGPVYVGTPSSNLHLGQYRYSETHQSRQNQGPTSDMPYQQDAYNRDSYDGAARYPGTGSAGYKGAAGTAYTMHNTQGHQPQNYGPPSGANFPPGFQQNQPPPPPPGQDMRYAQHQGPHQGFKMEDTAYVAAGTNMTASRPFQGDAYNAPRGAAVPIPQPTYAAPVQSHPGYTAQSNSTFTQPHPQDVGYGRASPAGPQQGYAQTPQYEDSAPSRNTASPSQNQNQPKDSSNNGRRFERENERHSFDRHQRPQPRR